MSNRQLILYVWYFSFCFDFKILTHLNRQTCIIFLYIVNVCICHLMPFMCTLYSTIKVHTFCFVFVSVHQYTQYTHPNLYLCIPHVGVLIFKMYVCIPHVGVLIFKMYVCIPNVICTLLSAKNTRLNSQHLTVIVLVGHCLVNKWPYV